MRIADCPDVAEVRELPKPNRDADDGRSVQPTTEVGELLRLWLGVKLDEVDDLVEEARQRVEALPDLRTMWFITGELTVRLAALELEVGRLREELHRMERRR
jgi:hypothetical protein